MDNLNEIISTIKLGHKEAYSDIVRYYQNQIFGYLYRLVSNHQDAEDLTQETFTIAFYRLNQLKNTNAFKSWLFSIAHNQALQYFRKKKTITLTNERALEAFRERVDQEEDSELLEHLRGILKPYDLSLLMLRVVEEMTYDDLSICLNKSAPALRKQYQRLRRKLAEQLGNDEEVYGYVK